MRNLKSILKIDEARTDIATALTLLRKHGVFDVLLWKGTLEVVGNFGSDDINKTALSGALSAGYKQALKDINSLLEVNMEKK